MVTLSPELVWAQLQVELLPAQVGRIDWSEFDIDGDGRLLGSEERAVVAVVRAVAVAELSVLIGSRPLALARSTPRRLAAPGESLGLLDPVVLRFEAKATQPVPSGPVVLAIYDRPLDPGGVVPVSLRFTGGMTLSDVRAHRAERRGSDRIEAVLTNNVPWVIATISAGLPTHDPVAKP